MPSRFLLEQNAASRGFPVVLDPEGVKVHPHLADNWKIRLEDPAFRQKILVTRVNEDMSITHSWETVCPISQTDAWFETTWAQFRSGEIYS